MNAPFFKERQTCKYKNLHSLLPTDQGPKAKKKCIKAQMCDPALGVYLFPADILLPGFTPSPFTVAIPKVCDIFNGR